LYIFANLSQYLATNIQPPADAELAELKIEGGVIGMNKGNLQQ
jgi:hypothetical protein